MPRSIFLGLRLLEVTRFRQELLQTNLCERFGPYSFVGRRAKCSWKSAFVLNRLSQILSFQARSYIHSQHSKTAHGIDQSCPFLIGSSVVLRKHQPPLVYFRLGCLNALLHLRPVGFEQGGLI